MGDLRPDNGGLWPPEDGGSQPGGLPDFPPEWGTIVVPDDASELEEEAEALRRELRRAARRDHVGRVLGLQPSHATIGETQSGVGVPLVIMAVAILTTLISLFVVTWDRRPTQPPPANTLPASANGAGPATAQAPSPKALADLTFTDSTGVPVRLGTMLPAVILLADGCSCADLALDTAMAAPASVRVLAVSRSAPNLAAAPTNVRAIADPDGVLRSRYAPDTTPSPDSAAALLVSRSGTVVAMIPRADSVTDLTADLARLPRA